MVENQHFKVRVAKRTFSVVVLCVLIAVLCCFKLFKFYSNNTFRMYYYNFHMSAKCMAISGYGKVGQNHVFICCMNI